MVFAQQLSFQARGRSVSPGGNPETGFYPFHSSQGVAKPNLRLHLALISPLKCQSSDYLSLNVDTSGRDMPRSAGLSGCGHTNSCARYEIDNTRRGISWETNVPARVNSLATKPP